MASKTVSASGITAVNPSNYSIVHTHDVDGGYAEDQSGTGTWGGNKSRLTQRWIHLGTTDDVATFTIRDLASGGYDIYYHWTENTNRSTDASLKVYDGAFEIGSVSINQENAPTADHTVATSGTVFEKIATNVTINNGTCHVRVFGGGNEYTMIGTVIVVANGVTPSESPSASDYTTLQAWEDWADGQGTDETAECYSYGNLGELYIQGWAQYKVVDIVVPDGESHGGDWSAGAYVSGSQAPLGVAWVKLTVRVYDLRIVDTKSSGSNHGVVQASGGSWNSAKFYLHRCLVQSNASSGTLALFMTNDGASSNRVNAYNTIGRYINAPGGGRVMWNNGGNGSDVYNCTFYGATQYRAVGGEHDTYNCLFLDCAVGDSGSVTHNDKIDGEASAHVVDAANGDFTLIEGSTAIDGGGDWGGSNTLEDVVGTTRGLGELRDVGAYEYVAVPSEPCKPDLNLEPCCEWPLSPNALVTIYGYDSRGNQTLAIDPKGNSTVTVFDGASRPTQMQQHLRERGQGDQAPAANSTMLPYGGAAVTTVTSYDGNGRTQRITDDNQNVTSYEYDSLDRETKMTYHDGSTVSREYNAASDVTTLTDANGSEFDNSFDPLGRKTQCDVTKAAGVLGTTEQKFEYDGLSRMTFARDSVDTTHADVSLDYDSLSRVLEDSQTFGGNTRNATNSEFNSHPASEFTYPDGRTIENTFDLLYRRTKVHDPAGAGTDIAEWEFFGPSRVAEMTLANGLICSHLNNARTRSAIQDEQTVPGWGGQASDRLGYDGAGRMITKRWLSGGINGSSHAYNDASAVVGQTTAYDRSSNKLYERALHAESRSGLYEPFDTDSKPQGGYDSLDRLRQYQRGVLSDAIAPNPDPEGGSITTAISLSGTDESKTYVLDGLGNWRRSVFTPAGGSETTDVRQHNSLNQITRTDDATTKVDFEYDGAESATNGNLENDGVRKYEWDALNRLKKVSKTPATPVTIAEYDYDAMGRRIRRDVSNGGLSGNITNGVTDFVYSDGNSQCCEERDGSNNADKQFVWGIYVDELLQQKRDISGTAKDDYPLCDTLYRSVALTDDTGAIIEAIRHRRVRQHAHVQRRRHRQQLVRRRRHDDRHSQVRVHLHRPSLRPRDRNLLLPRTLLRAGVG